MFKINHFIPPRISPTNTTFYDLDYKGEGHYPLMTIDNYCMNH